MNRFTVLITTGLIALLASSFGLPSQAADPEPLAKVANACSENEVWEFSDKLPDLWRTLLKSPANNPKGTWNAYFASDYLRRTAKTPELQALAGWLTARSLNRMEMPHLAHQAFDGVLSKFQQRNLGSIRMAALECLERIRVTAPGLELSAEAVTSLKSLRELKLSRAQTAIIQRTLVSRFKRGPVQSDLSLFTPGSSHEAFARMLWAAHNDNDTGVVEAGTRFLGLVTESDLLNSEREAAELLIARSLYHLGKYDKAISAFKNISRSSSYFVQSYSDLAWLYLARRKYPESLSTAYNLIVGPLANGFNPEIPSIAAMALFETCHYAEAYRTLGLFKKKYAPAHEWLSALKTSSTNLYSVTLANLKGVSKSPMPKMILFDWINLPVFRAAQAEINLLMDEKARGEKLLGEVEVLSKKASRDYVPTVTAIREILRGFLRQVPRDLDTQTQAIQKALAERSQWMLSELKAVAENNKLISVDILHSAGDDIIRENVKSADDSKSIRRGTTNPDGLDWGSYSDEADGGEIWEDELGFLKSDLETICPKP